MLPEESHHIDKKQLSFILITTFLTFMGFSIIIPVIPFLVQQYLPHGTENEVALYVGGLLSVYSLCQFFSAPGLGVLSDRFGRRPILLVSLLGSVIGYLFLGIGGSIGMLFLGRVIDGLTGGNISTIYAYIADITQPRERGKFFGQLGAAGGVGFMLGPAIGGLLANVSLTAPLFFAAFVTFLTMLWGYFILPESLRAEHKIAKVDLAHLNPFAQFGNILRINVLRRLFSTGFLFFLAFSSLYATSSVFFKDTFAFDPTHIGWVLFLVGLIDIVAQGFLVNKLLPIFGDEPTALIGLVLCAVGFLIEGSTSIWPTQLVLYLAVIIVTIGDGLFEPSFAGLISNSVEPTMQGRIQGANQGMQSVTRIFGPLLGVWLYQYAHGLPFVGEAILVILCFMLLVMTHLSAQSMNVKIKRTL